MPPALGTVKPGETALVTRMCDENGQLGHTDLGTTSVYLEGIDNTEIIDTVHVRCAPMVP